MSIKQLTIRLLLISTLPISLIAEQNKVVSTHDGDTITILTEQKERVRVRLHGIDAPEKKQAYGTAARKRLSELTKGKKIQIKQKGKDRYKRILGVVYANGEDINAKMVFDGYAWAFVKYSKDYVKQEREAREKKRGLWQDKNAIPPWEWRKR